MTVAIQVEQLTKHYSGGVKALKGVSFSVQDGDFIALLGPNGAGKSTTIGILCSLVEKNSGDVSVYGYDLVHQRTQVKQHIGLVPQEFNFNNFEKVMDILITQAGYYGITADVAKPRAEHYLKALGLWDKREARAMQLSGGMKRRLMIARALIHDPKILILDEPTAGVDIELRRLMWRFLEEVNASGKTVILTTHYLEEAEQLCRNIIIIDQGEVVVNTDKKSLLASIQTEHYLIDLPEPLTNLPMIDGATITQPDPQTLDIAWPKAQPINQLFAQLSEQGVTVLGLRNKSNRLEELFLDMTKKSSDSATMGEKK
ncbi:MAG: ABC transporter ATP-binding protein [Pseudomonadota bacterium]|nr:ABC transporter ATP-binding protein [Pseudomonadota bacterium]